ncbi:sulfite exporter TauE/SafE family protein [Nocardia sp. alder85J]|uniref:sulfite exporter TauE/SafE family protein n=1 Tax=Nocardia sp. alder85J TaxID=2862949 RepID=UPI001CD7460F|nr:sulfite exporter TauE/SafE family protein [Nocardia sp. alder85J]MCX4091493.1 sulfite exporter TauE/SafE family protein [Nocardia sp. alder85J]
MTAVEVVELLLVGFAAGLVSVLVSLASLVSYPALLGLGLSPVSANVTNTVSLVFIGMGSAAGSRSELAGTRRIVLRLGAVAAAGGAAGSALLLVAPAVTFQAVVPFLIGGASVFLLGQPYLARRRERRAAAEPWWRAPVLWIAMFGASVYAGYFGAAGGILVLAIMTAMFPQWTPHRVNAVKNVVAVFANGAAAIGFAGFGPVHWSFVVPLAVGFFLGGRVGPVVARRLPDNTLRVVAAGCGIAMAVKFAL